MAGIKKVAVLGSGVMGGAIAAHVANAGVPVVLLDIVPKDSNDRSALAKGAVTRMLKQKPAPFMHKRNAKLITPGNLEDDLGLLADCDWICEAVLENLQVKQINYIVTGFDKVSTGALYIDQGIFSPATCKFREISQVDIAA